MVWLVSRVAFTLLDYPFGLGDMKYVPVIVCRTYMRILTIILI